MALNEGQMGEANGNAERDPRLERLYRDAARERPPARLDAAILAAARREVGAGPRPVASALRRWHVPISIAAVIVVSVSLVILVSEEEVVQLKESPVPSIAKSAGAPAATPASPTLPEADQETSQRRLPASREVRRESRDATKVVPKSELAAGARPEPGSPAVAATGAMATPAGKPLPQPFVAAPSPADEERARSAAENAAAGRVASAPTAPSELQEAAPSRADARRPAPLAGAMVLESAKQDRPRAWHGFEKEPPEKWLARIEELKVQGRGAEAQEMLAEFKRRFPQHPLPAGLR